MLASGRKILLIFFLLILHYSLLFSQISHFLPAMRANDNNKELSNDSADWKVHRLIKDIHPSSSAYPSISFGGEDREQFRYFSHVNFGDVPTGSDDEDIYMQHRLLLHTDIMVNSWLRFFIQLNSCHANGRNPELHKADRDDLGVMQGFADLEFKGKLGFRLRAGRQELSYGAERILALRDGPTIRQNFDGVQAALNAGKYKLDLMAVQPVLYKPGVFDNSRRKQEHIYGAYFSSSAIQNHQAELYYFNAGFHNAIFASDTADDTRNYLGTRIARIKGNLNYEIEITLQNGKHGKSNVKAWHVSPQVSYRFNEAIFQPKFTLRASAFSGDKKANDNELNTFRPVSAKPPVYDLTPVGPANIVLVSPEAEFMFSPCLTLILRYLNVNRLSGNDGMYPSDMRKMTRIKNEEGIELGRHILNGAAFDLLYVPNKHIAILLYGGCFTAGNYIRNTGNGRNITAFSLRVNYRL
ncbi:MAG TPA: alginate export family protein [Bacteroidales bacterium]|nr:alginate export family protein [Bacteroidales bacterium]